jgi:hypothetical protein
MLCVLSFQTAHVFETLNLNTRDESNYTKSRDQLSDDPNERRQSFHSHKGNAQPFGPADLCRIDIAKPDGQSVHR